MDWRVKAMVQGGLSWLPGGSSINDALQQTLGGRRNADHHVDQKIEADWLVDASYLKELGRDWRGFNIVEIGTGWGPVLPLCFAIAGGCRCWTYDVGRHLDGRLTRAAVERIGAHLEALARAAGEDLGLVRERWEAIRASKTLPEILERANLDYRAPADATRTGLPPHSVDMVFSNSVLEHVPVVVLDALMTEARRILKPNGLVLHGVNCGDHYAYFDRRITPIHYLRYTSRTWRYFNNGILYQNRLRPRDFIAAAERAGLRVVLRRQTPRQALLDRLPSLPIAPEFSQYPPEELCCTSVDFVAVSD